ncbi:granule-bound starch synthase 1b, chloroplastic/amyloplastic-like isoform X2 [Carex rostrata]
MATLTASQLPTCTYTKTKYELRFFGKAQIVACPWLRLSNSFKSLQVRSCAVNPALNNSKQSASNENFENIDMLQRMKIVFVSADITMWSKTRCLGNVLDGLPLALVANGHKVMVVTPFYGHYSDAWDTGFWAEIDVGDQYETVRYFHRHESGVNRVFVDNSLFLQKVWGMAGCTDNHDTQLCFSLLCLAALEAPRILKFRSQHFPGPYGEDVVFVCNDWHTALLPCYLKSLYQPHGIYANAKVAFCIHDITSQGRFAIDDFALLNLPDSFRPSFEFTDGYEKLGKGKKINWMKAGIRECDLLLTVSPYHAEELRSVVECGLQLGKFITSKQPAIKGIANGIDVNKWNPVVDGFIVANYDASTANEVKPLNKEALQAATGLLVNRDIPLIAFISHLEEQKGADILAAALPELMDENVQFVVLAIGKKRIELKFEALENKYPEKLRILTSLTDQWLHRVIAGADFLVLPNRFEPGGFIQLLGMQYGTLPVVSCTGGLVDTVIDAETGFYIGRFSTKYEEIDPSDVLRVIATLKRATKVVGTALHKEMIWNCMSQDLSWKGPAKGWERALLRLGVKGSEAGTEKEMEPLAKENEAEK